MRRFGLMVSAVALILTGLAGPAAACLPDPAPRWDRLLGDEHRPMFIGRVESIVPNSPSETFGGVTVTGATARIRMLEVIQGAPSSAVAEVTGAVSVSFRDPPTSPLCLNYLNLNEGDLAVVVEQEGVTTAYRSGEIPSSLLPFFERRQ
jgi:hypothetical protein